jgi:predicted transcriptional regulator
MTVSTRKNDMNNTSPVQVTWPEVAPVANPAVPVLPEITSAIHAVDIPLDIDEVPATLPQDRDELAASKRYQLVVLGRGEGKGRESVLIRLPQALLNRLGDLANGSRSALIELALHHMVQELADARSRGEPMLMVEAKELQEKLEKDLQDCVQSNSQDDHVNQTVDEASNRPRRWMDKAKKIGAIRAPHLRRRLPLSHLHNPNNSASAGGGGSDGS